MSIETYRETYEFVSKTLILAPEPSIEQMVSYEEFASKTLLIAAAGQHEKEIVSLLAQMPRHHDAPVFISEFIMKQALYKKYHTLFDWSGKRITSFARLFGAEKRAEIIKLCDQEQSTKDFFYIGSERNRIVHDGLAVASIEKTFSEIWESYESSLEFINLLRKLLH